MTNNITYQQLVSMLKEKITQEMNYGGNFLYVDRSQKMPENLDVNHLLKLAQKSESVAQETKKESIAPMKEQEKVIRENKGEEMTGLSKRDTFMALARECIACMSCKLAETRNKVVFGSGPVDAELVIIGEAPGYYEDQSGHPFVGKAGQLLTKMLAGIEINREDVFICNVIKCRPPENRDPESDEIEACRSWLVKQLQIIKPKIICSMGKFAAQFLTNTQNTMGTYRNKTFSYEGIPVVCTYHPSYLLRNEGEKKKAWEDLKRLRSILHELRQN